ncbi:hypothetical protein DVA67_024105 [Solirubrobacter sp. CPCC 204708]|uniref:Nucleoside phosphorylase domain-containing protein n=1 Tax=Solirubrobacter deserti TaxID=2282478 RepID=A0ABT4RKS7_9ACTN|nr:hypothetical protein [Solirubrobacter deserti]MBE2319080.1 hypothetical protein [Solirubrobacter deserti]MDA0139159.1 hypothetical protein [Solirubrobacter deserti]
MSRPGRVQIARAACFELLGRVFANPDAIKQEMLRRDCSSWIEDLDEPGRVWAEHALAESYKPPRQRASLMHPPTPSAPDRERIDVLLVTVVPNEAEAAEIVFDLGRDHPGARRREDGRRYHEASLETHRAGRLNLVLTNIGESGNTTAQGALRSMLRLYEPELVLLAGIAAGRLDSVKLGDLVLPRKVWYLEKGASLPDEFRREAQERRLPQRLYTLVGEHRIRRTGFYEQLQEALTQLDDDQLPPGVKRTHKPGFDSDASVVASEKLLRDGSLRKLASAEGVDRKIKLGDMESWGLVQAVGSGSVGEWTGDNPPEWMVVRAVSDFGEVDKDDNWQMFASVCALVGARHFLQVTYERRKDAVL